MNWLLGYTKSDNRVKSFIALILKTVVRNALSFGKTLQSNDREKRVFFRIHQSQLTIQFVEQKRAQTLEVFGLPSPILGP